MLDDNDFRNDHAHLVIPGLHTNSTYQHCKSSCSLLFSLSLLTFPCSVPLWSFIVLSATHSWKQTCKDYYKLGRNNQIWKPLVMRKWNTVSFDIPINSYYQFYKRRYLPPFFFYISFPVLSPPYIYFLSFHFHPFLSVYISPFLDTALKS